MVQMLRIPSFAPVRVVLLTITALFILVFVEEPWVSGPVISLAIAAYSFLSLKRIIWFLSLLLWVPVITVLTALAIDNPKPLLLVAMAAFVIPSFWLGWLTPSTARDKWVRRGGGFAVYSILALFVGFFSLLRMFLD